MKILLKILLKKFNSRLIAKKIHQNSIVFAGNSWRIILIIVVNTGMIILVTAEEGVRVRVML